MLPAKGKGMGRLGQIWIRLGMGMGMGIRFRSLIQIKEKQVFCRICIKVWKQTLVCKIRDKLLAWSHKVSL